MAVAVLDSNNVDIKMDNIINKSNLEKIESFLNDPQYKEVLESSANYNTRLCIERRLRLPFIDTQTGVAQNHSSLFMHPRQRIPGLLPGQIYSYPRPRWRKKRRQYLTMNSRTFARAADSILDEGEVHSISQVENPALQDTDSKDSQLLKDEVPKEWYYDEQDMLEMEAYDEPDPDSDLDYEETYKKGRKKKGTGRGRGTDSPSTPGRKKGAAGGGRGRKKGGHSFEPTPGDPDKPFACELCGARYKTRPGLTYHYGHSHKEGASDDNSRDSNASTLTPMNVAMPPAAGPSGMPVPFPGVPGQGLQPIQGSAGGNNMGGLGEVAPPVQQHGGQPSPGQVYQDSYVSFLNQTPGSQPRARNRSGQPVPPAGGTGIQQPPMTIPQAAPLPPNLPPSQPPVPSIPQHPPTNISTEEPQMPVLPPENPIEPPSTVPPEGPPKDGPPKGGPSPYCDFCLGDSRENKKTGCAEELVSCSDCGRSGHPSCLQFTPNMMISVKKYRWQCIECKCCSVCGNSDNDDQLLFCDDCDRGYHMYCLTPPLDNPPEGSWSCKVCVNIFHK
ncbi:zinc finger protein ubi-d4 B isoform X1 [Harmonia axyridis]|uniref:zinc finger protein ubi-d4 B isoform X1 n=1 Tax=Harmonia axyridis TaxID=115357 RepID=UPI001E277EA2|nr:zinc finger protein ubi-d4 B isoform X1 [Harmonia axyridis]